MKYTDWLVPRLVHLEEYRAFLENVPQRISDLRHRVEMINASRPDKISVMSSSRDPDEAIINSIMERQELEISESIIRSDVAWLESGLAKLTPDERMILERFYIRRRKDYLERLTEDLHVERSEVYRLKDQALRRLARLLVGRVEV